MFLQCYHESDNTHIHTWKTLGITGRIGKHAEETKVGKAAEGITGTSIIVTGWKNNVQQYTS